MPEFIENERFGLVFAKTVSIISGTMEVGYAILYRLTISSGVHYDVPSALLNTLFSVQSSLFMYCIS